ncbi:hypothetical protein [Yersinia mollaretii]|uniref:hypothetical protein n=1 Tax=Yersinia mollaretii TaxID=33060 RepID=UPI00119E61E2|nr:hypothetical protein [Yersinia mollaretii]
MEAAVENVLRAFAKGARTEMVAVKEKYPITEHDKHFTEILNRHAKKITALPIEIQPKTFPAKIWLSYYVRQIDKEIRVQL